MKTLFWFIKLVLGLAVVGYLGCLVSSRCPACGKPTDMFCGIEVCHNCKWTEIFS